MPSIVTATMIESVASISAKFFMRSITSGARSFCFNWIILTNAWRMACGEKANAVFQVSSLIGSALLIVPLSWEFLHPRARIGRGVKEHFCRVGIVLNLCPGGVVEDLLCFFLGPLTPWFLFFLVGVDGERREKTRIRSKTKAVFMGFNLSAPKAQNMIARGKREARRPW